MQPGRISVTLGLGSAPYQRLLPKTLSQLGMLRRVLSFGSELEVQDPDGTGSLRLVRRFSEYKLANRFLWAAWRHLPKTGSSQLPKVVACWLADRLASGYVPPSSIFHGWLAVSLTCLQTAKQRGAITILQNPTLHLQHWQDEVKAECNRFGLNLKNCSGVLPPLLIRRAQREYELCDRIVVLSSVARQSFEQFGYASKTIVVWPGVDHRLFHPRVKRPSRSLFRACYVGRIEAAKGIVYLLEAWKRLSLPRAELLLVGEIQPEVKPLLEKYADTNIKLSGWLSPERLAECYRRSNIFVFPSVNEGFGIVLLEAMACGLPVIATEKTGARDCVTESEDGFVVAARNVDALAEAILWCYQNPEKTVAMGNAARAKIEGLFTLAHYEERLISFYRSLTSESIKPVFGGSG